MPSSAPVPASLTRIVPWAHALLAPVLRPGDLAVDLTAGLGRDTLFLFEQVGLRGRVVAFDVQHDALEATAQLLAAAGADLYRHASPPSRPFPPGVHLLACGHEQLRACLAEAPAAIIANLGYLPGGNPDLTTRSASTLAALAQATGLLAAGGRLAVVAYPGHPGGDAEAECVGDFFSRLDAGSWQVLRLAVGNQSGGPFLLVAEKRQ